VIQSVGHPLGIAGTFAILRGLGHRLTNRTLDITEKPARPAGPSGGIRDRHYHVLPVIHA